MWWCQLIDLLKFETRPSSLMIFGMANYLFHYYQEIPLTNRVRGPYRELLTEFFPLRFMAQARSARAMNRRGKNEADP